MDPLILVILGLASHAIKKTLNHNAGFQKNKKFDALRQTELKPHPPPTPSTKTGKKKSAKLRTHDPAEEGGETTKRRIASKQRMNEQAREPGTGVERRDTFVSYSPRNVLILTPERARDAK